MRSADFHSFPNSTKQDERAKREREKTKWIHVMDEITSSRPVVASVLAREYIYSLSSVSKGNGSRKYYSTERQRATPHSEAALSLRIPRFRSREESKESVTDVDASLLASRAIEKMTEKEKESAAPRAEITDLN